MLVVEARVMTEHLQRANALELLQISRLALATKAASDRWFPSDATLPQLLSGYNSPNEAK